MFESVSMKKTKTKKIEALSLKSLNKISPIFGLVSLYWLLNVPVSAIDSKPLVHWRVPKEAKVSAALRWPTEGFVGAVQAVC